MQMGDLTSKTEIAEEARTLREHLQRWRTLREKQAQGDLDIGENLLLKTYDCVLADFGLRDPDRSK